MARKIIGTIYLLHFDKRFKHAGHYIGFAENLENRLSEHEKGIGARLTQVVGEAGIGFECVRTWDGTRKDERKLKNRKDACSLCAKCREDRNRRKRESRQRREKEKKELALAA